MKTKTILLATLLCGANLVRAQITPSMTIPNPLPNYDGSYDETGTNHLFYPNDGEVRFNNTDKTDAKSTVKFYTMNTHPKKYLMSNNNISYVHHKTNTATSGADSIQRVDLEWMGSSTGAFLARVDTQNYGKLHYFTQWFSAAGRTEVKGGAAIACQSIYPNIDLVYTSNNAGLVMYFIVYPGGNYKTIRMNVAGSKANSIVSNKLKIEANWEYTTLERPNMYQYALAGNVISPVNVGTADWQSIGGSKYQIGSTSSYNSSLPLIIQIKQSNAVAATTPGLKWSTYFGGNGFEFLTKTHEDASDNLYVGGLSWSSAATFPQAAGVQPLSGNNYDACLAKFGPNGAHLFSAFLGGPSSEEIRDFDFNGSAITCVGRTSGSLQTVPKSGATNDNTFGGSSWDGFIWELNFVSGTGAIVNNWLRYYGGNGEEELNACKFDASGNLFVVGESSSTNLTPMGPIGSYTQNIVAAQVGPPNTPLGSDAIIGKFNSASTETWFTYYGTDSLGVNAHNNAGDYFYGLTINGSDLYVCGKAGGTNLPSRLNNKSNNLNFDGILVHFTTAGALPTNSAKFTGSIVNYAVKTLWGEVYTVGQAATTMATVNSGLYYFNGSLSGTNDACFSVHDQGIGVTLHNTYFGGSGEDMANDIHFTSNNLFYISGGTNSNNFPVNSIGTIYDTTAVGLNDNFITCFMKNNVNMVYSSYLGSDWQDSNQYPPFFNSQFQIANTTISVDSQNRLHLLGTTNSYNTFPLHDNGGAPTYFQSTKAGIPGPSGAGDATITRFDVVSLNAIVGIKDFENTQFVFGLYPNPTKDIITITNSAISKDNLRYAIYDLEGKKLAEGRIDAADAKQIKVSQLSQGVYIINVSNGTKTYSNKFVKVND